MKRTLLICGFLLACLPIMAQNKGEMYLGLATDLSFGTQRTTTYSGSYSRMESQPLGFSFGVQAEYAYFVANNLRLGLAVGLPYSSSPLGKDANSIWLYSKTIGFDINPNIAYYVRITDKFFYTPELGFSYGLGSYKEDVSGNITYNMIYSNYLVYLHLLAFEFRVSQSFGLGVMVGQLSYSYLTIKDKTEPDRNMGFGRFTGNINSGGIAARIYF